MSVESKGEVIRSDIWGAWWLRKRCREEKVANRRSGFAILLPGMLSSALRQNQNQHDNDDEQHRRGQWPAPFQPAFRDRLVEEIADCRAQRTSEDERCPEQPHAVRARREVKDCEHRETRSEHHR